MKGAGQAHLFQLFVAPGAPNAALAQSNLISFCNRYLPGLHSIELVDVFRDSRHTIENGIFMTPTLVRVSPLPRLRIVGTLGDPAALAAALHLEASIE